MSIPTPDILDFSHATSGVTLELRDPAHPLLYRTVGLVIGSAFDDTLTSSHGAELDGGAGADHLVGNLLYGGAGDDRLVGYTNIHHHASQFADDHLYGGDGDDQIYGGGGPSFYGKGETDYLYGGAGNDIIKESDSSVDRPGQGGAAAVIDGGAGADIMTGGASGKDVFVFDNVSDFTDGKSWDIITNFLKTEHIDLSGIDADITKPGNQAFTWIGRAHFDGHAGELRYGHNQHGDAIVKGDVDGDGLADFQLVLLGKSHVYADNFVL